MIYRGSRLDVFRMEMRRLTHAGGERDHDGAAHGKALRQELLETLLQSPQVK